MQRSEPDRGAVDGEDEVGVNVMNAEKRYSNTIRSVCVPVLDRIVNR